MKILEKYILKSVKFYLQHSPLELRYANVSFSQFGEDLALANLIGSKKGIYVDVGAFHPFCFSNTYLFYKKGWSGLNIEPNPIGFNLLEKFRKRDKNLQLAVSDEQKSVRFLDNLTYSRILEDDEQLEKGEKEINVETKPLREILSNAFPPSTKIDFLSIDCEGHDLNVIQSNDWTKYRPAFIVTEDHCRIEESEIVSFLKDVNYRPICRLGLSRIFSDNESGYSA